MIYIAREENGRVILEEVKEILVLKEEKINGKNCYTPLNSIHSRTINPEWDHFVIQNQCICDADADIEGNVKRILIPEIERFVDYNGDYHHLEYVEFAGNVYVRMFKNDGKVSGVYITEINKWVESSYDHLEYKEFAGKTYINDIDEHGKVKRSYMFKDKEERWAEAYYDHLEYQEFNGKIYINDINEHGQVKRIYIFMIEEYWGILFKEWEASYDHLEYQEFNGKIYINDIDEHGKVKRIYMSMIERWVESSYDHLEYKEFAGKTYINDIDEDGKVKRIYIYMKVEKHIDMSSIEWWWMESSYDHLEYQEFAGKTYINDIGEHGKVKRIYMPTIEEFWGLTGKWRRLSKGCWESSYDHLEYQEFAGKTYINDIGEHGKVKRIYMSAIQRWVESISYCDHLELKEISGNVYINDIDVDGKVKRKHLGEEWFTSFHDHLEFKQVKGVIFLNDINQYEQAKAIYNVSSKIWYATDFNHLEFKEISGNIYIIDIDVNGKIKGIIINGEKRKSNFDHLEIKTEVNGKLIIVDVDEYENKRRVWNF